MPPEQLPALLLAILAVGYTPGPANIYAMSCSLRYGWRASMRMWCGLLCGFLAAALLAAVAAHFAGMAFKQYVPFLRYLAAAYILYLAWKTYRSGCLIRWGCRTDLLERLHRAADQRQDHSLRPQLLLGIRPSVFREIHRPAPGLGPSSACRPGGQPSMALAGGAIKPFVSRYAGTVSIVMAIVLLVCAVMMLFI